MANSEAPMDPRPYVRMSTDLPLNPKLAAIDDPAASWAYVVSICYAGQTLSDGHIPVAAVIRLAGVDKAVATALAEQELWHLPSHTCSRCPQPKPGHAYIHDYLQHQRSAEEVRDLTSKRREAGRKGAAKRWAASKNVAADLPEDAPAGSKPIANAMASAQQELWQMDGKPIAEERRGEENYTAPAALPAQRAALAVVPDPPTLTVTQRSKAITDAYALAEPMCKWPAVNAIVIKAIKADRWSDVEIQAALMRLAGDNRSVTVDSLRTELTGPPTARAAPKPSTTDQRVAIGLALAAKFDGLGPAAITGGTA